MHTKFGRGLFAVGRVRSGQAIGWYDGEHITRAEYTRLTAATGLWHTLQGQRGRMINGIASATGMQFANSGRNDRPNNASYSEATALLQAKAEIEAGGEVLLAYGWTPAAWKEIDSRVVGMLAWERRGPGEGLGQGGGQHVEEVAVARRGEGIATHLIRTMRRHDGRGGEGPESVTELAVHRRNATARRLYAGLKFTECRWWQRKGEGWEAVGESLYEPERPSGEDGETGGVAMRAGGRALEEELRRRGARMGEPVRGLRYVVVEGGKEALKEAGLLDGARAMTNRVYGGEAWWVEGRRNRVECLYKQDASTRFVIALETEEAEGGGEGQGEEGGGTGGGRGAGGAQGGESAEVDPD